MEYTAREFMLESFRRMLRQGGPAYDKERGTCLYKTSDGRRCAIGIMMPMDIYRDEWDESAEPPANVLIDSDVSITDMAALTGFLGSMQNAHDSAARLPGENESTEPRNFFRLFKNNLRKTALEHDIEL